MPDIDYVLVWEHARNAWRNTTSDGGADYLAAGEVIREAVEAAYTPPEPAPDPGLVTWTPENGPLADALRDLPDGHPVTITATATWWPDQPMRKPHLKLDKDDCGSPVMGVGDALVTSASWLPATPTWATPRPPLVVAGGNTLYILGADERYHPTANAHDAGYTAAELAAEFESTHIRVLIDADGNHAEA